MIDLKDFITYVKTTGLPLGCFYLVQITGGNGRSNVAQNVSMLVESVNIPGINIMTNEMRIFGEVTEMAYGINYNPASLTIYVGNDSATKVFFDDWMNEVFDRQTRTSGYYKDYTRDVIITILDRNETPIYSVKLVEAFPKTMSDITLGATDKDVIKLNVSLAFRYWTTDIITSISSLDLKNEIAKQQAVRDNLASNIVSGAYTGNLKTGNLRDWGQPNAIGKELSLYGPQLGGSLGRSLSGAARTLDNNPSTWASSFQNSLNGLTSNFVSMGSGLGDLGKALNDVTSPVSAIATSAAGVSGTLGSIDSTLSALGLGTPFSKIRQNLNSTAGQLSTVARLKDVPSHLGTIGANMTGMGSTFQNVSKSLDQVSTAPAKFKSALNKLGVNLDTQGNNLTNGAANLDRYAGTQ